jgi:predicted small integral membrane protein
LLIRLTKTFMVAALAAFACIVAYDNAVKAMMAGNPYFSTVKPTL